MRQIQVIGVADITYIGTNQSEYTLVLERDDGERFMLPSGMDQLQMEHFLQFAFVEEHQTSQQSVYDEQQYLEVDEFVEEPSTSRQPVRYNPPVKELDGSFAHLAGGDQDYEGPPDDIESI